MGKNDENCTFSTLTNHAHERSNHAHFFSFLYLRVSTRIRLWGGAVEPSGTEPETGW